MKELKSVLKKCAFGAAAFVLFFLFCLPASAFEDKQNNLCKKSRHFATIKTNNAENEHSSPTDEETDSELKEFVTTPEEYGNFIDSLPEDVIDKLPEGAFSDKSDDISAAAGELGGITLMLGVFLDAFGSSLTDVLPTLATLLGIVILSALCVTVGSGSSGGINSTLSFASRLCSFSVISACSVAALDRLEAYFNSLFSAVTAFVPLNGVLLAMGGNLTGAASSSMNLTLTLSVCQAICTKTVIPVFCICLSLTLITLFEGQSATVGQSASVSVKKWYTTLLGFVMMIITVSSLSQSIISSKADSAAMRGAKFAAGSFIPISGGALSSTLGTIGASVSLLRSSIGVIGISVIMLLLIPTVVELALLRGVFSLAGFVSGMLGCTGEQRLLGEICTLYGFLEGVAALTSAVFLISFAVFATTAGALG